jgi:hypothetical protein
VRVGWVMKEGEDHAVKTKEKHREEWRRLLNPYR